MTAGARGAVPQDRRVTIVPANADWPDRFSRIADEIRAALGPLALRIDHIGSTSVPGLASKDVIDIQVTVSALDHGGLAQALERAGFVGRPEVAADHRPPGANGPDLDWQKLHFAREDERRVNLHVRVAGSANERYALLFRDYLRAEPLAAEAYARLKAALAGLGIDRRTYAEVKDPACDLIIVAAEQWATRTGWRP